MVFCLCGRRCFSRTLVINPVIKGQTFEKPKKHNDIISTIQSTQKNEKNLDKIKSTLTNVRIPNEIVPENKTHDIMEPTQKNEKNLNEIKSTLTNVKKTTEIVPENKTNDVLEPIIETKAHQHLQINPTSKEISVINTITTSLVSSEKTEEIIGQREEELKFRPKTKKQQAPPAPISKNPEVKYNDNMNSIEVKLDNSVLDNKSEIIKEEDKKKVNFEDNDDDDDDDDDDLSMQHVNAPKLSVDLQLEVNERREGVAPIPIRIDENIEKLSVFIKDPKDEELIKLAIKNNDFLNQIISEEQIKDVVAAMYDKEIPSKHIIVKQGDKGSHMYVSAKGTFHIIVDGKVITEFNDCRVFGELALLYNAKRQATIKAATSGRVWVLDNSVYQKIMIRHNMRKQDELMNFLISNEILNVVGNEALQIVANLLKSEFFKSGQVIVKQGDRGNKFYIIRAGTVTITKEGEGVVGVYKKGDCFGELALLEEDARQATVTANAPGVECLTLARKEFINHLGEIKKFKYIKVKESPKDSIRSVQAEHEDIKLKDLRIIKTLGVGGFGRVELVQHTKIESLVFALKYLKKIEVVNQNQQEHVYNEKIIQMASRSPFIVRLYRTYRDTKYIYFLMESCLGGDLWSLLQKQKNRRFEEKEARFICSCVLEAFDYLHSRGIVYRDLKPENLLIASNGYIKLTDFGFAKKISGRGKTYTFAGTPEYVAPEIVLNRGHDRAVDYWAFGAFIFEMLAGRTPFRTDDSTHMRTYNKILSGIDTVQFPTYIHLKARHLIEKLCRPVPSERLGMQRHGIHDIKVHKWFLGLDWQKLVRCEISSPFKPKLKGPIDTIYFDHFKRDTDNPPEELSGWDEKF